MQAKDALGRRGEELAAEYLERAGLRCSTATGAASPASSTSWRRAARPGGLRGQDPLGHEVRQPVEAVTAEEAPPAAPARRRVAGRAPGARVRRGALRRGRGARRRPGRRSRRARPGGGLMGLARGRTRSRWSASSGHLVEIEADVARAARAPPGRAARCGAARGAGTGSGRHRQQPASSGRSGGSPSASRPASLPKRGSGFDIGIAVAVLARRGRGARPGRSTGWRSSASWGSTAGCARSAECCLLSRPPAARGFRRVRCRAPTRPRRRWSPTCGC